MMEPGLPFSVTTSDDGDRVTVHAAGELDLLAAPHLRAALLEATHRGVANVGLDLASVSFIDSTGLSVIVQAWRRLGAEGGCLALIAASESVARVVTTSGLAALLGLRA